MNYKMKFSEDGTATITISAKLPMPESPMEASAYPGTAMKQIEVLLPVLLSELVFGRTPGDGSGLTPPVVSAMTIT